MNTETTKQLQNKPGAWIAITTDRNKMNTEITKQLRYKLIDTCDAMLGLVNMSSEQLVKIVSLERELNEAQNILKQCLSIMPVGYVPTHTVENLPEMIGDLAKALAEETTEREQLERELAEMTKQRDHYKTACDQYSEDETLNMLAEARKQRDTLAEALLPFSKMMGGYMFLNFDYIIKAEQALAAVKGGVA